MPKTEQRLQASLSLIDFNAAIINTLKIYRPIYIPSRPEHMDAAEAQKADSLVRITLSDNGGPIDPQMEKNAALVMKAYQAVGILFKDKGVKKVPGDEGSVHVRTLEVDLNDRTLAQKVELAKRTVIPALAGIAAMQEAARRGNGEYNFEATPSETDMQRFVAAAAQFADVKTVIQGRGDKAK